MMNIGRLGSSRPSPKNVLMLGSSVVVGSWSALRSRLQLCIFQVSVFLPQHAAGKALSHPSPHDTTTTSSLSSLWPTPTLYKLRLCTHIWPLVPRSHSRVVVSPVHVMPEQTHNAKSFLAARWCRCHRVSYVIRSNPTADPVL
jgi:hypothetical protein